MFYYYFGKLWLFTLKSGRAGSYAAFSNGKCLWYSPIQKQMDIGSAFCFMFCSNSFLVSVTFWFLFSAHREHFFQVFFDIDQPDVNLPYS